MNKSTELLQDFSDYPLFKEIDSYKENLISMSIVLPNLMKWTDTSSGAWRGNLQDFIRTRCIVTDDEGTEFYQVPTHLISEHDRLHRAIDSLALARKYTPTSYVVQVVSQFDAYIGELIKIVLTNKPELFNSLNKSIEFSKLMEFSTMEEAKEYIIEKEVESVLRESHNEHFEYLEKRLSIKLREFASYKDFIEITERRNLFVHTNGKVSSQYIMNCKRFGITLDSKIVKGFELKGDYDYAMRSIECFLEIGIKLGYVIWRKIFTEDAEIIDTVINQLCFDLIKDGAFRVASRVLEFIISVNKKDRSDSIRLNMMLNLAQSYKWSKDSKFDSFIKEIDVSSSGVNYKLAKAILDEDYESAKKYMEKCDEEEVPQSAYLNWPIFREFIKTEQFVEAYRSKYGENAELNLSTSAK